jgi:septum formation protein
MILASASPRRLELLASMGVSCKVHPADIDETSREGELPVELVGRLAHEKAWEAARACALPEGEPLLAADTVVWVDDTALGKPRDADDARRMMHLLSGRTHHVTTGVCLLLEDEQGKMHERSFCETTDVTFRALSDAEIDAYVASGEGVDKAGAYAVQGTGRLLVEGIAGDYDNVVGLPVARVLRELAELQAPDGQTVLLELLSTQRA